MEQHFRDLFNSIKDDRTLVDDLEEKYKEIAGEPYMNAIHLNDIGNILHEMKERNDKTERFAVMVLEYTAELLLKVKELKEELKEERIMGEIGYEVMHFIIERGLFTVEDEVIVWSATAPQQITEFIESLRREKKCLNG